MKFEIASFVRQVQSIDICHSAHGDIDQLRLLALVVVMHDSVECSALALIDSDGASRDYWKLDASTLDE